MAGTADASVIMIGGPSATGKSTLAESLARRFGMNHVDVDMFYVAFREVVPREIAPPGLHEEDDEEFWAKPVEELVELYLHIQEYVCAALESVIFSQVTKKRSLVIEGAWLIPEFAARKAFRDVETDVRCLFLFEPDAGEMERRRRERAYPWMRAFDEQVMQNVAAMRYRHGLEMKRRAEGLGLPVLEPRPFETLEARAVEALRLA